MMKRVEPIEQRRCALCDIRLKLRKGGKPNVRADWGYDGLFCTLRDAAEFGHAAWRTGYRVKANR